MDIYDVLGTIGGSAVVGFVGAGMLQTMNPSGESLNGFIMCSILGFIIICCDRNITNYKGEDDDEYI